LDASMKRTVLEQNGVRLAKAIGAAFFETSAVRVFILSLSVDPPS
jgi:hypothetical protein